MTTLRERLMKIGAGSSGTAAQSNCSSYCAPNGMPRGLPRTLGDAIVAKSPNLRLTYRPA
jgi:hypothetical protein